MMDLQRPPDWEDPVKIPDVDTEFRTILVPFDGSHCAEIALAYAVVLARRSSANVVVVVAYNPPVTIRRRGSLVVQDTRADMEE
jgi:nucleotide-binding universal stress UspA family protein